MIERRTRLKTYSHLAEARRIPSDYEIATSRLLYYVDRGFEVQTPIAAWYEKHQKGTRFKCGDWDRFEDPRATTYTRYVSLQRTQEAFIDRLLNSMESPAYRSGVTGSWLESLSLLFSALRFPYHGLQMGASYLGQLAPSGRLAIAFLFQASDEMRKIQRFSYRLAQLREINPGAAEAGRLAWQEEAKWQPLRKLIEQLLVTYDWSEGWVALNLCVQPAMDELFLVSLAERARGQGDYLLGELLASLYEDSLWHLRWTESLLRLLHAESPENLPWVRELFENWAARASEALSGLGAELGMNSSRFEAPVRKILADLTA